MDSFWHVLRFQSVPMQNLYRLVNVLNVAVMSSNAHQNDAVHFMHVTGILNVILLPVNKHQNMHAPNVEVCFLYGKIKKKGEMLVCLNEQCGYTVTLLDEDKTDAEAHVS